MNPASNRLMIATGWAALRPFRRIFTRLAAGNRARPTTRPVPGTISGPTPPRDRNGPGTTTTGGSTVPGPSIRSGADLPQHPASAPEHITCSACGQPLEDRATARCWNPWADHSPDCPSGHHARRVYRWSYDSDDLLPWFCADCKRRFQDPHLRRLDELCELALATAESFR